MVLTLGIGATTAIFSVVDAVVLRGCHSTSTIGSSQSVNAAAPGSRAGAIPRAGGARFRGAAELLDWAAQQRVFEAIAAIASGWLTLREPGVEPESLVPQRVTANFSTCCGCGRPSGARSPRRTKPPAAIAWRCSARRMAASIRRRSPNRRPRDPARGCRRGRQTRDGYEVVGVMPPGFAYPVGVGRSTDIWIPYVVPVNQRIRDPASRSTTCKSSRG